MKVYIKLLLVAGLCLQLNQSTAQENAKNDKPVTKPSFSSIAQLGIVDGELNTSFQLQSINGMQYRTWFAGVGVGFDYYFVRSIPLFAAVHKHLIKTSPLFLYAHTGINMPWVKKAGDAVMYGSKFKNGFLYDLGFGYSFKLRSKNAVLLSVGYAQKNMEEVRIKPSYWGIPGQPVSYDHLSYKLRRISIKAGIKF